MNTSVPLFLQRLVVTPGAHTYSQAWLAEDMRARLEGLPDGRHIAQMVGFIYQHSAIEQRHYEAPIEEIDRRPDWYQLVNEANLVLGARALDALMAEGIKTADCDGLIVVSNTFAGFPALSRRLQERCGFPLDALCYDLAALGCAGATQGLYLAATLIQSGACRNVCILCVDAMATFGQSRRHVEAPSIAQLVAHCLASDGAAALVVGADPGPKPIFAFRQIELMSRLWPGALDLNDLTAGTDNQPYISVGKEIRTRLLAELDGLLDSRTLEAPLLMHPGGLALMRLLAEHYPQLADSIRVSLEVLREHGNLSAPSVFWVLDYALRGQIRLAPRFRLEALGPGIVANMLLLDGVSFPTEE